MRELDWETFAVPTEKDYLCSEAGCWWKHREEGTEMTVSGGTFFHMEKDDSQLSGWGKWLNMVCSIRNRYGFKGKGKPATIVSDSELT